jgi:hypothetical protein
MSELSRRLGYYGSKERWEKWFRGVYEKAGQMYCGSNSAKALNLEHFPLPLTWIDWENYHCSTGHLK